jgi:hypothetical protein
MANYDGLLPNGVQEPYALRSSYKNKTRQFLPMRSATGRSSSSRANHSTKGLLAGERRSNNALSPGPLVLGFPNCSTTYKGIDSPPSRDLQKKG